MNIERFQKADVEKWHEQISCLLAEAFEISFSADITSPEKCYTKVDELKKYLEDDKAIFFAVVEGAELFGFLWAYPRDVGNEGRLHLNHFILRKEIRNKGIGTKLIELLKDYADQYHFSGIELMVSKSNKKAISYYERIGFDIERYQMILHTEE